MRQKLSLYIHIPFCMSKCNYCSFVSVVAKDDVKERYLNCLKKEIQLRAKELSGNYEVTTIYIGGGTPSCLPDGFIKNILQHVYKFFTVQNKAEITIEVNPRTITSEKVREFMFAGVNRVSIGFQCVNNKVLETMGRLHNVDDFNKCVSMLRVQGMNNINADIILGYPTQTLEDVKNSVDLLVKLNIPHVSTYMLSIEEQTPLFDAVYANKVKLPSEEEVIKMYDYATKTLRTAGLERYEISNFAKPGCASLHNKIYWIRGNYLGLGLAAHSFIAPQRFNNTKELANYVSLLEKTDDIPVAEVKFLTLEEEKEETVMLSLRTSEGLDCLGYQAKFNENFLALKKVKIASYITGGFLILDPTTKFLRATDKGMLVLNKIILELLTD